MYLGDDGSYVEDEDENEKFVSVGVKVAGVFSIPDLDMAREVGTESVVDEELYVLGGVTIRLW